MDDRELKRLLEDLLEGFEYEHKYAEPDYHDIYPNEIFDFQRERADQEHRQKLRDLSDTCADLRDAILLIQTRLGGQ
jgi:hypothetical protein